MGWSERFASLASNADMTVGVIGLGYVGLPTAIGFHDAGFTVWGVDVSQRTVDMVKAGNNPTGDPDRTRTRPRTLTKVDFLGASTHF